MGQGTRDTMFRWRRLFVPSVPRAAIPVSRYTGMVARAKTPGGKRVTICVKVSEADAAAIDAARGEVTRSAWGRGMLLAAVTGGMPAQAGAVRQRAAEPVSSPPPVSPGRAPALRPEKCAHPKARVIKGQCRACWEFVGKR
jgi:hypothetical protein